MGYDIGNDKFIPILAACADYALPVVIPAELDPASRDHIHAKPEDIAKILERFPSLHLCAAHFGGAVHHEDVLKHLCGKNIWFDTSFSGLGLSLSGVKKILENHDPDKIMFGSDMPWEASAESMTFLEVLELNDGQKRKLFGENAERFFKYKNHGFTPCICAGSSAG